MEKLITVNEVAELLAVRPATIYQWVKQRHIPHVVLSKGARKNCVRFRIRAIEAWLRNREKKAHRGRL